MKNLQECIQAQQQISEISLKAIIGSFSARSLKKGEYLLEAGQICREMAFIEEGYLRMFSLANGREVTLWIGNEGSFITSLSSFIFETENYWSIQALTDCSVQLVSRKDHFRLCREHPQWLELDNILLARAFSLLEQNMFSHLHTTARQRFEALLSTNPAIFNHVPLQHIASMLGITPETLSRLRKSLSDTTS